MAVDIDDQNDAARITDPQLKTFKQIDDLHHCAKGSAFRAFKQLSIRQQGQWREGEHFYCVDSRTQPALFAQLQRSGRLYASTVNAVLVTDAGYQTIAQILANTYDSRNP